MYKTLITKLQSYPKPYGSTGVPFWDDDHISKSMLEAHLDPDGDGASRNHGFIAKSAEWIASLCTTGGSLLDMGCGPGIYAEFLNDQGFTITGIDLSPRSIKHAKKSSIAKNKIIKYICQDYLSIDYQGEFDVVILIYCDFGVLPEADRQVLLNKVYSALKPGGIFVFDVFTARQYDGFQEGLSSNFEEKGFWSPEPHLCLKRNKRYDGNTFLEQYIILTNTEHKVYNIWNHGFTQPELLENLRNTGFKNIDFFADVAGREFNSDSPTLCAVARK